jgi:hypothetical protein
MARRTLASSASTRWLVDSPVPQHRVDEPYQLASHKHECPPMLVAGRLAELLLVVGTELRARTPYRVGGLHYAVVVGVVKIM